MAYLIFGIIGAVVGVGGLIFGFTTYNRNKKTDDTADGKQIGIMLSDIGYVKAGIDDIKIDTREFRSEIQKLHDRYARLDEALKAVIKRVDKLEKFHVPN